jgi:glucosamine--fructose-6-phosphate aminotransferase (isomerizing)
MNKSPFLEQIFSLPDLIRDSAARLSSTSARLAELTGGDDISQIILTGCGDSHHAAIATRLAFQQLAGLPCHALTAMELARYQAGQLRLQKSGRIVVVGISASGQVTRTVEAVELAKKAGATALALTGNLKSDLAGVADSVYHVADSQTFIQNEGVIVPGTRSYFLSLLALYHLAIQLGMAREIRPSSKLTASISELKSMADLVERTIGTCEPSVVRLIEEWSDAERFVFCGSGPNYGTALFSAAKMIEAAGDAAIGQDLEEWAHLQYFERQVDTPTIVITAAEQDGDRAREITTAAQAIGRRVALIAPESGACYVELQGDQRLTTAGKVSDCLSPLLTCLPGLLLAAYRAEEISEPFFRGFGGGRSRQGGGGISRIRNSNRIEKILD